jgi:hypothetical protein
MQHNDCIMDDFEKVASVVAVFLAIPFGVLHDIANTESIAVAAVNDNVCGLIFVSRIMLPVGRIDVLLDLP